jgi:hypothetical protein
MAVDYLEIVSSKKATKGTNDGWKVLPTDIGCATSQEGDLDPQSTELL